MASEMDRLDSLIAAAKENQQARKEGRETTPVSPMPTGNSPQGGVSTNSPAVGEFADKAKQVGAGLLTGTIQGSTLGLGDDLAVLNQSAGQWLNNEGWNYGQNRENMDNLLDYADDTGAYLGGEILGAFNPVGIPMAATNYADKVTRGGRGLFGALKRMNTQGKVGAGLGAGYAYNEGERDILDLATTGAAGYGLGAVGQGVLGEAAPTVVNSALGRTSARKITDQFADKAIPGSPNSPQQLMRAADELGTNESVLDLNALQSGSSPENNVAALERMVAMIAKAELPAAQGRRATTKDVESFQRAVNTVASGVNRINDDIAQRITSVTGPRLAPAERLEKLNKALEGPRQAYSDIFKATGSTPLSPGSIRDDLATAVSKSLGQDVTDLQGPELAVYNFVQNQIRPQKVNPKTGQVVRDSDATAPMTLNSLHNVRKSIAAKMKPGQAITDTLPVDRTTRKILATILDDVDELIDAQTGGMYKQIKGRFADQAEISEAYELGQQTYQNRAHDVNGEDLADYVEYIKGTPRYEAFIEGFKGAVGEEVANEGALPALNRLFGQTSENVDPLNIKAGNVEMLKDIYGDDAVNALQEIYEDRAPRLAVAKQLETVLGFKQYHPQAIENVDELSDAMLASVPAVSKHATMWRASQLRALSRIFNRPGMAEGRMMLDMIGSTGEEATETLQDYLTKAQKDQSAPIGGGAGMLFENTEREQRQNPSLLEELRERPTPNLMELLGLED